MRVIDTLTLVPSRYDDPDVWNSRDQFGDKDAPGQWIELRMYSRYARAVLQFAVLYTGPNGATRVEHRGPQVPGPHGSLIPQSTVLSAHPMPRAETIEVAEGDVLVCNGQRMVIADDDPYGYPDLVTEAEWGLIVARRAVQEQIDEVRAYYSADDPGANILVTKLYRVKQRIADKADEMRARSRPDADASAETDGDTSHAV